MYQIFLLSSSKFIVVLTFATVDFGLTRMLSIDSVICSIGVSVASIQQVLQTLHLHVDAEGYKLASCTYTTKATNAAVARMQQGM